MAKYEMDMTRGPLLTKIIRFSIPLILTGILSLIVFRTTAKDELK